MILIINRLWQMPSFMLFFIILFYAGLLSIFFLAGRATAERHLKKYHMEGITENVIENLTAENVKYRLIIERLKEDNKKFVNALSLARHAVMKVGE